MSYFYNNRSAVVPMANVIYGNWGNNGLWTIIDYGRELWAIGKFNAAQLWKMFYSDTERSISLRDGGHN
jgi:hypothetical protein